jgi:hypothetical protein
MGDRAMIAILWLVLLVIILALASRIQLPEIRLGAGGNLGQMLQLSALKIDVQEIMQVIISIALLASGLFVVLSHEYGATEQHWAYGSMGTVVGFWLRPTRSRR